MSSIVCVCVCASEVVEIGVLIQFDGSIFQRRPPVFLTGFTRQVGSVEDALEDALEDASRFSPGCCVRFLKLFFVCWSSCWDCGWGIVWWQIPRQSEERGGVLMSAAAPSPGSSLPRRQSDASGIVLEAGDECRGFTRSSSCSRIRLWYFLLLVALKRTLELKSTWDWATRGFLAIFKTDPTQPKKENSKKRKDIKLERKQHNNNNNNYNKKMVVNYRAVAIAMALLKEPIRKGKMEHSPPRDCTQCTSTLWWWIDRWRRRSTRPPAAILQELPLSLLLLLLPMCGSWTPSSLNWRRVTFNQVGQSSSRLSHTFTPPPLPPCFHCPITSFQIWHSSIPSSSSLPPNLVLSCDPVSFKMRSEHPGASGSIREQLRQEESQMCWLEVLIKLRLNK